MAQFGESILDSRVTASTIGTATAADTEFALLLGGGADVRFSEHWAARINTDFLRTHFVNSGQSHIRLILGAVYRF